jgi:hypothetical protein
MVSTVAAEQGSGGVSPFLANAAISTTIPVVALTWRVMPRITRLLYS